MQFQKGHSALTVIEAMDHLSHMAEVDISIPAEMKRGSLTEEQLSERMSALSWRDPEYYAYNRERIRETFSVLLKYMTELSEKGKGYLREEQAQLGIQALMQLVMEAAQKIDAHTQIFKGNAEAQSVTELEEFKQLTHFYHTKIVQRFHTAPQAEEMWRAQWGSGEPSTGREAVLVDLESVRRDREYEFFLIRKEDGTPYFNRALVRHMQLVAQFEALWMDPKREDLLSRIPLLLDRDAHLVAREMLHALAPHVDEFFKEAMKFKTTPLIAAVSKALMALMMAANSRNLMQNTVGKCALDYYADFHSYLRSALSSPEYQKVAASSPDASEHFVHIAARLAEALCNAFFLKASARQDKVLFIQKLIERGAKGSVTQKQTASPLAFWNNLRDQDQSLRHALRQGFNGPLRKAIQLFHESGELKGFAPIGPRNPPEQLYILSGGDVHTTCIRLPCPLVQAFIGRVEVVKEFEGFLHSLGPQKKDQRLLLINVQDRTSWQEHARCLSIEEMQKRSAYKRTLRVATFPKNTDFYMQSGSYIEWDDAVEFKKALKEQVASGEQCGFFFPLEIDLPELLKFVDKALEIIHKGFFGGKERLVHKNRLDFIEIFYLFLTLKLIEEFKPDSLGFICKDGVDTGPAASAELFAFLRMMNNPSHFSKNEEELLLWMIYAPALMVRERGMDPQRLSRMVSALSIVAAELEAHHKETVAACNKLYKRPFFERIAISFAT
jgi:hypothetical protein